ncbi:chemotaxis protein CheA [Brucepastera parasyntrophica]|uniref:chemotaxis protein CheA n=1 Tax=Brucepastera parasyntrophica TaxID=2880008 RepID=UPI00210D8298|nr:chemotaxis protein CheA [Brucepastera parasyntrophica]ULQ58920.1 chemotaxis protein CheA [Brucepastera parasyntrophica]
MTNNDQMLDVFKEEALELLGTLEENLLELEKDPKNKEILSAVFRVMHTIKGSAGMFGLEQISAFTHEIETILTDLRDGKLDVTKEMIGYTLIARDKILWMLENSVESTDPLTPEMLEFLADFKKAVGYTPPEVKPAEPDPQPETPETQKKNQPLEANAEPDATWHIEFIPGVDIFRRGANPLAIISELRSMGELVIIPIFHESPTLIRLNPENCFTSWEFFLTTGASENEIKDVFLFVEDISEIKITLMGDDLNEDAAHKKLGEILVERGKLNKDTLDRILNEKKLLGELLLEEKLVKPVDIKLALEEQKQLEKIQKTKTEQANMSTIRVKSEKLDQLMALVGELVTTQARILQVSRMYEDDELTAIVEQLGRLTDELRNNSMSIRMVPVGTTFSTFKRLVRDLSMELGKNVELVTYGGETELDKTVIEKLNDPLVHIIRNSLDHGIEKPEVRKERGKPENSKLMLSATQTGASVYISVEDDGNGLDPKAIREKAITMGLIRPEDMLTEQEIYHLILLPGFSTKKEVTSVSGRGVGMDVVNRQMELINGSVSIESKEHEFSRITLKIPLTLAIIDGLLTRIGNEYYVIPLSVVVSCLEFIRAKEQNKSDIIIFHNHQLPFVNMRDFFNIPGERPVIEQLVVVHSKNQQIALLVDQVIGGNQTVIKPLGKLYRHAEGISSGTILGDGSVALILDVEQIFEATKKAET